MQVAASKAAGGPAKANSASSLNRKPSSSSVDTFLYIRFVPSTIADLASLTSALADALGRRGAADAAQVELFVPGKPAQGKKPATYGRAFLRVPSSSSSPDVARAIEEFLVTRTKEDDDERRPRVACHASVLRGKSLARRPAKNPLAGQLETDPLYEAYLESTSSKPATPAAAAPPAVPEPARDPVVDSLVLQALANLSAKSRGNKSKNPSAKEKKQKPASGNGAKQSQRAPKKPEPCPACGGACGGACDARQRQAPAPAQAQRAPKPAPAAPAPVSSNWQCVACTYENDAEAFTCIICTTPKM